MMGECPAGSSILRGIRDVRACIFLEKQNLPFFFSQELPLICTQGSCATIRKR
jgi:hypothetical protein